MISNISWGSYTMCMALLTTGYYFVVALVYYRPEIYQLAENDIEGSDPELYPEAHLLMGALDRTIENAAHTAQAKNELLYALQTQLCNYPHLSETAFRKKIQQLVREKCMKQCSIEISEDELNGLWKN
jgi:hypothetical protein